MKREYQVKACVKERGGRIRAVREGETPQIWALYQLQDDDICWKWRAYFASEEDARMALAEVGANGYPDTYPDYLLTSAEADAVCGHLRQAGEYCEDLNLSVCCSSLCLLDAQIVVAERRLAQARAIINAARLRDKNGGGRQ